MSNSPAQTETRANQPDAFRNFPHPLRLAAAMGGLVSAVTVTVALRGGSTTGVAMPGVLLAVGALMSAFTASRTPKRSAVVFGATVLPGYLVLHAWLLGITAPGYAMLSVAVALHAAVFVYLAGRLHSRVRSVWLFGLCAGLLLGATDVFRARLFFGGYPWYLTASDLIDYRFARAMAAHVGMLGVNSLVCVFLGGFVTLIAFSYYRREKRDGGTPKTVRRFWIGICLGSSALLLHALRQPNTPLATAAMDPDGVPIAVVQTNVPQSNKQLASMEDRVEQFNDAARMTAMAGERSPSLIVWPETMFPGNALNDGAVGALRESGASYFEMTADLRDALLAVQSRVGASMLVGAMALESPRIVPDEEPGYVRLEHDGSYNSVFLIEGGGVNAERYDKIYLTPFGEVMPLISRWKWLERRLLAFGAPGMSFDLSAGTSEHTFEIAGTRLATPICFEITIPHMCRRLVFRDGERRAGVMINVTNDGWFGSSRSGRLKHLLLSRWRAAELATPVVRAANTGVSVLIDERGRVVTDDEFVPFDGSRAPKETGLAARDRVAGVLFTRVVPGTRTTLYARTGDVVGWATLLLGLALAAWAVWPRKNHRPATPPVANPAPAGNASGA